MKKQSYLYGILPSLWCFLAAEGEKLKTFRARVYLYATYAVPILSFLYLFNYATRPDVGLSGIFLFLFLQSLRKPISLISLYPSFFPSLLITERITAHRKGSIYTLRQRGAVARDILYQ